MTGGVQGRVLVLSACLAVAAAACAASDGGIHARLGYSESAGLRVVEVPEGPSRNAGLLVNDRVVSIDGQPVRAMTMAEVVERLRGPVGTTVTIEVARDDDLVELTIDRVPYR